MQTLAQGLTISGLIGAFTAIWLGAAQPARAGSGGGADLGSLQALIGPPDGSEGLCFALGMKPCPQLPTVTQAVLEVAGLSNTPPEIARAKKNTARGRHIDAGNPSRPPAVNPLSTLPVDPSVLATLNPLAFIRGQSGDKSDGHQAATPTQLYDTEADTFLYAVANGAGGGQPDKLLLFYDDLSRTNKNLQQGKISAKISLPLTVLKGGTERFVSAILQFKAPNKKQLDCSASMITGNFSGAVDSKGNPVQSMVKPSDIGVDCAVVFAASPASSHAHAIFEVAIPLLIASAVDPVTATIDPGYSSNTLSIWPALFSTDGVPGFPFGTNGINCSIGTGPGAPPFGPAVGCPTDKNTKLTTCTPPGTYSLCARLPGERADLVPAG